MTSFIMYIIVYNIVSGINMQKNNGNTISGLFFYIGFTIGTMLCAGQVSVSS